MSGLAYTPGPWSLCHHLKSPANDKACPCGYRGVVYGPDNDVAMAVCQPGHDPAPPGQDGTEPKRYPRDVELANARLIAAAPDMLEALQDLVQTLQRNMHTPLVKKCGGPLGRAIEAIAKATGGEA